MGCQQAVPRDLWTITLPGLKLRLCVFWWRSGLPKKNSGKKSEHNGRGDGNASDICVIDLSAISGIQKCKMRIHERTFFGTALNAPAAKCKTSLVLVAHTVRKASNLSCRDDKSHSFGLHTTGGMWLDHKLSRGGKLRWWLWIKKGKKQRKARSIDRMRSVFGQIRQVLPKLI